MLETELGILCMETMRSTHDTSTWIRKLSTVIKIKCVSRKLQGTDPGINVYFNELTDSLIPAISAYGYKQTTENLYEGNIHKRE